MFSSSQYSRQWLKKAPCNSTRNRGVFCHNFESCFRRGQRHSLHSATSGDIRHMSSASWLSPLCCQCNEVMPLQMLAVHVKTCKGKMVTDDEVRAFFLVGGWGLRMLEMTKHIMFIKLLFYICMFAVLWHMHCGEQDHLNRSLQSKITTV